MSQQSAKPGTQPQESRLHNVDGVVVYTRKDQHGKPTCVDAIDEDEAKIRAIADRLQHRGYGVMRQRNPRAGKVYYLFKATWAGPGDPPDDPFNETTTATTTTTTTTTRTGPSTSTSTSPRKRRSPGGRSR